MTQSLSVKCKLIVTTNLRPEIDQTLAGDLLMLAIRFCRLLRKKIVGIQPSYIIKPIIRLRLQLDWKPTMS